MTFRNAPIPKCSYGAPTISRGGVEYPQGDNELQNFMFAERLRQEREARPKGRIALWVIPRDPMCPACMEKMWLTKAEYDAKFTKQREERLAREGPYVPPRRIAGEWMAELNKELKVKDEHGN